MKKLLTNQQGYNLMVVILVSTIFLVVGLSIVTMSLQGSIRTSIRETDVKATAEARQLMDEIIAELQQNVSINQGDESIDPQYKLSLRKLDNNLVPSSFNLKLDKIIDDKIYGKFDPNHLSYVQKLKVKELTTDPPYSISKDKAFTRVYKITLVVKNKKGKSESLIERTLERTVILSPTPSFLQYAVGSFNPVEHSGLQLNGSPNINGNIFANQLDISEKAKFDTNEEKPRSLKISAPLPEINGDIYTTNTGLLTVEKPENFYKGKVPKFKNQSAFIDMNLDQTITERKTAFLKSHQISSEIGDGSNPESIQKYIDKVLNNLVLKPLSSLFQIISLPGGKQETYLPDLGSLISNTSDKILSIDAPNGVTLSNNTTNLLINRLNIRGNLTLNTKKFLTITDGIYVDGKVTINNFDQLNIKNIVATKGIEIVNDTDQLTIGCLLNKDGTGNAFCDKQGTIISNGSIDITNYSRKGLSIEGKVSTSSLNINNEKGNLTINAPILSTGKVFIKALQPVKMNAESLIGGDLELNPVKTSISILDNLIVNGNLNIYGIDEMNSLQENDNAIFDSVIYVGSTSSITNVNIKGDNSTGERKRLVLLSKGDLELFRINEFSPSTNVTPLAGYFYTDSNAELYGVGSIFHINGGLFAHNSLTINGIRGEASNENELIRFSDNGDAPKKEQEDKNPRFKVDYDPMVLFRRLDALPTVNSLQVIPDVTTVK